MGHHLVMDSLRKCWLQNWEAIHGPLGAVVLREAQGISMALRCVYAQVPWMARATNTIHKLTPHAASAKVLNQWPAGTAHSPCRGRSATQTADDSHAPFWSQRCQSFGLCAKHHNAVMLLKTQEKAFWACRGNRSYYVLFCPAITARPKLGDPASNPSLS